MCMRWKCLLSDDAMNGNKIIHHKYRYLKIYAMKGNLKLNALKEN